MLAVTQFEVYALENGRWTLHARYPSEQKKEAQWDARNTEVATGFPTKIVRDTFYPDLNESERVTTYISPNAKKAEAKTPSRTPGPSRTHTPQRVRTFRRSTVSAPVAGQTALRAIVAAGFSLMAATLTAGIIGWALHRFVALGLDIPNTIMSMVLTYSYVVMFLLFFFSLFRSRLPLHRVISYIWHKTAKSLPSARAEVQQQTGKQPPRVKPKHDRKTTPETLAEWQDLRTRRGDPDIFNEATNDATKAVSPPEAQKPAEQALPSLAKPAAAEAPKSAPIKEPVAAAKAAAPATSVAPPAPKTATPQKTPQPPASAPIPAIEEPVSYDDFAHVSLRGFIEAVVLTATRQSMPNDPVARRAKALVVMAAADGLISMPEASVANKKAFLSWGLVLVGLTEAAADMFIEQRTTHSTAPNNQALLQASQNAIKAFLAGQFQIAELAGALAAWRTPFGLPQVQPEPEASFEATSETPEVMPREADVFMLTELRPPPADTTGSPELDEHNIVVRNALAALGGSEVKHTGKGIFARFTSASAAIAGARAVQDQLGVRAALAVVGPMRPEEDPMISPALFLQAEAALAATEAGEVFLSPQLPGETTGDHQDIVSDPTALPAAGGSEPAMVA